MHNISTNENKVNLIPRLFCLFVKQASELCGWILIETVRQRATHVAMYSWPGRFYTKMMNFMREPRHNVVLSKRDWNYCFTLFYSSPGILLTSVAVADFLEKKTFASRRKACKFLSFFLLFFFFFFSKSRVVNKKAQYYKLNYRDWEWNLKRLFS